MSNLGQLLGISKLRIMQLEDALAEASAGNGHRKNAKPRPLSTRGRILEVLENATRGLKQAEIGAALGDVNPMTVYMALRDLRLCKPPLVETSGTGFNNDPYRYAKPGKFAAEERR